MKKILTVLAIFFAVKIYSQPAGTIMAYAGTKESLSKLPAMGWVVCDGSLYDGTTVKYQKLFAVIGTSWGGDGAKKFAVPDLRGLFLRGVSDTTNIDPDAERRDKSRPDLNSSGNGKNAVGSKQPDVMNDHTHTYPYGSWQKNGEKGSGIGYVGVDKQNTWITNGINETDIKSTENRPKNAYVYYIIKL